MGGRRAVVRPIVICGVNANRVLPMRGAGLEDDGVLYQEEGRIYGIAFLSDIILLV